MERINNNNVNGKNLATRSIKKHAFYGIIIVVKGVQQRTKNFSRPQFVDN